MNEEQFAEWEYTVPEFRDYLKETFKVTREGKPITLNYAHLLCGYGRLPKEMGGWVLKIRKVRGRKAITITDQKFDFNAGNRKEVGTPINS